MASIAPRRSRWLAVGALLLAACVRDTGSRPDTAVSVVPGTGFVHRVILQGRVAGASRVHVYLEGDGRPFATRHLPAGDPSARRPLARELMALDDTPSIYLSRPCYDGQASAPGCTPRLWTVARYGEEVVGSMASALQSLLTNLAIGHCTLIGYSGGGVLAMLIGQRVDAVDRVVTVAANLDLAAWTARHRYTPLSESLDPARLAPLPARVAQLHFAGGRDDNVPPALIKRALVLQPDAQIEIIAEAAHARGWHSAWPRLLATRIKRPTAR